MKGLEPSQAVVQDAIRGLCAVHACLQYRTPHDSLTLVRRFFPPGSAGLWRTSVLVGVGSGSPWWVLPPTNYKPKASL